MEICTKSLDGLSILGNSVLLPDACFTTVMNSFYESILNKDVKFTFEGIIPIIAQYFAIFGKHNVITRLNPCNTLGLIQCLCAHLK